jgi:hypothetical protein
MYHIYSMTVILLKLFVLRVIFIIVNMASEFLDFDTETVILKSKQPFYIIWIKDCEYNKLLRYVCSSKVVIIW